MVLRDTRKRQAYDRALPDGGLRYTAETSEAAKTAEEERTGKTPNGKKFYATAQRAESAGDLVQAISSLKMALTFEPKNPFFKAELDRLAPPKPKRKKVSPRKDPAAE